MVNSRLEELSKAYEERHGYNHTEWVFVEEDLPPDDRVVEVWIINDGDTNIFGERARFSEHIGVWMSPDYDFRYYNVVAWKDVN